MDIKPIHNDLEYDVALKLASSYFNAEPEPGTPEGDRFELLLTVIEPYEAEHHPIAPPSTVITKEN